ncbi:MULTISPECIES: hypothetical protein [Streptomyces]|nr:MULTISPECIES: hypothetical protein [Streptomyces]MCC3654411.1 hypothetical protein [Streptomyces sp. S07_1.15]WSQ71187.1 hypothetical protein OG463_06810 [Streptomyces xinghaiensis]
MSQHVHVRLTKDLGVSERGELIEESYCRCGAQWARLLTVEQGESEQ